jgi:cobalt/nickel transport system permease protein
MRHDFLDRYGRLDSPIHRRSASWKAATAFGLIALTVAVPHSRLWLVIPIAIAIGTVLVLSRIPVRFVLTRVLLFEPLAVIASLAALAQPEGLSIAASMIFKSTICLTTMIILANTMPFAEFLLLLRRLRTPAILVTILALTYRYVFVLVDEAERLGRARLSRTFHRSRAQRWRDLGGLVGRLFIRSTERAERIYAAMTARGWQ